MVPNHSENPVYDGIEAQIPHLHRYACALAHNSTTADDLVQECVTRALSKSHLYRSGSNLRAWLFTILHNIYISEMRRQSKAGFPVAPEDAGPQLSVRPNQDHGLTLGALHKAMATLPRSQRYALELIGVHGLSYKEASKVIDLPVGTLKSRVSRARTAVRTALAGTVHPHARDRSLRHQDAAASLDG